MLIVFDLESTITEDEFWDTFPETKELLAQGLTGEQDYAKALRKRFKMVEGMPKKEFESHARNLTLRDDADEFFKWAHEKKIRLAIVSSGFDFFTKLVAEELKVKHWKANSVVYKDSKVVGAKEPILAAEGKKQFVENLQNEYKIKHKYTVVVGDGANDLKMMELARFKVGMCAKPVVASKVDYNITSFRELKELIEKL